MLIQCPECEGQISTKAIACPHCGNPMDPTIPTTRRKKQKPKRMRLPNGFGQISEIKNQNLRKPFRVMVTVGTSETGRPICKPLKPTAYFETYNEAYTALVEYHENPYSIADSTTMNELYERWYLEWSSNKAKGTLPGVKNAWNRCGPLWNIPVKDLRIRHIKECIDSADVTENVKKRMKMVLNLLLDYALIYELTDKNYSRLYTLNLGPDKVAKPHITYTDDEMKILWNVEGLYMVADMTLIQCYSGWRPQEIFNMKLSDIDLDKLTFCGGVKTDSSKNRIVPIHSKIEHIVRRYYELADKSNCEYLFSTRLGKKMTHMAFTRDFYPMVEALKINPDHRPHDGRVRFVTSAKNENVNEYAIKYLVGHKIKDITENTYTKRNLKWLREEIEKVK